MGTGSSGAATRVGRSPKDRRLALAACLVAVGAAWACAPTVRSARTRDATRGGLAGGVGADLGRVASRCFDEQQIDELTAASDIDPRFTCSMQWKLSAALDIATAALARERDCRELFEIVGQDVWELLDSARYRLASALQEAQVCVRADAFTVVGGRVTFLCRGFFRLSDLDAATVVLHEALHHAGLSEWPVDTRAARSHEISRLVANRCRLADGRRQPGRDAAALDP